MPVAPDIFANPGGDAASYFEPGHNRQGLLWSEDERITTILERVFQRVLASSRKHAVDLRTATLITRIRHVAGAKRRRGVFP